MISPLIRKDIATEKCEMFTLKGFESDSLIAGGWIRSVRFNSFSDGWLDFWFAEFCSPVFKVDGEDSRVGMSDISTLHVDQAEIVDLNLATGCSNAPAYLRIALARVEGNIQTSVCMLRIVGGLQYYMAR